LCDSCTYINALSSTFSSIDPLDSGSFIEAHSTYYIPLAYQGPNSILGDRPTAICKLGDSWSMHGAE
jgi:hypothetical protein